MSSANSTQPDQTEGHLSLGDVLFALSYLLSGGCGDCDSCVINELDMTADQQTALKNYPQTEDGNEDRERFLAELRHLKRAENARSGQTTRSAATATTSASQSTCTGTKRSHDDGEEDEEKASKRRKN